MVTLDEMETFVRVVDLGGLSAAARRQVISTAMVSKRLLSLERQLGTRLLHRTTRRQSLTDAGRSFYERCVDVLDRVHAAEAEAENRRIDVTGTLRIASPGAMGTHLLTPLLADYLRRHPRVDVEVQFLERHVNLVEDGFDAAFRLGVVKDAGMVTRPLRAFPRWLVCSAEYARRRDLPQKPEQLAQHECIVFEGERLEAEWALRGPRRLSVPVQGRARFSSLEAVLMAARHQLGIAALPQYMVEAAVTARELVRVLPSWDVEPPVSTLYYLPDPLMPRKLRTFVDLVLERYGA